ncbi:DHA2 family efflux MFS transporter permease subunit [Mycobacterium haemophilum]|uniref:Major facilitator transporter n=1 Tax=Mycobacterium haemophilum TaxID=29311 RepID=A0A0I9TNG3_9MYCO|nr:DHA2 family efflux MFS transporter permease subunit [Mycobacterium haemophilum]KLO29940.1 major facilitator transporter [Mycobacterium haemophilum]KLO38685.1 major facilitator transporter [Mycobacterium haemophilum]KLO45002.1 major facilitator transporter [Mycobacterium haemophilum]KLO56346.1 major facilitator transporter [Mycobacterium haemophilum]
MLSNAMDEAGSASADASPSAATQAAADGGGHYPESLDAGLLRIAGVCVLASVMAVLDVTVVSVAQRTFIVQFGSTQAIVAWTMTGYTLALATVIPITGWAADRFGTKRLFMGSLAAFTLGSLLCALAPNILLLIIFRASQGIGGGMLLPLTFMIMTREAGPARLGRLMAVLGIPMLLGPIGGPILGGWLIDAYGWKWIFLINLPVGLFAFALAALVFGKDRPAPSETLDFIGVLLLSPGVATFLYGVSSIPDRGTVADRQVMIPVTIGLALIIAFVLHAWFRADHPLIDLRLFSNRVVTRANVTMLVFAVAFFGTGLLLPSYFQQVLHQTPMQSGVYLIPQGLGAMLTMPFAGRFMDKRGPGKSVLLGIMLICVGLGTFTFGVARQADYLPTLLAGLAIMGMGMGCTMMPLSGSSVQALTPHQIARGTMLISVNQQVGGSMGTALMSVVLTSQFNRSENITAANKLALAEHNAVRRGVPVDPSAIPGQALTPDFAGSVLHDLSHAYATVFALAVVLVASTIIPAAFLPKKPPGQR